MTPAMPAKSLENFSLDRLPTPIGTVFSPPLSEIIRGLLKYSNNITAEAIGATAMTN